MITKDEIDENAAKLDIHVANVERDYVFSWLIKLFNENAYLSSVLILKGGNALRKVFLPDTRFSDDLDFSTEGPIDPRKVQLEINNVCQEAEQRCGVQFVVDQNTFEQDRIIDGKKTVYKGTLYFRDFYGLDGQITINIQIDITEFEKLFLKPVFRPLIHPYSDASECAAMVRSMALEEVLASKLKCLIQRRHSNDLFDFVYATFFAPPDGLERNLVVSTFLKKTIFEPSPGAAKDILVGLPFAFFRGAWKQFIVCPVQSRLDFDEVEEGFLKTIEQLFSSFGTGGRTLAFVPVRFREPILEAGRNHKLINLTYDGVKREVEPYSLAYKRRKDGKAFEYFYGYDRTGGDSGPGIKAFLPFRIQSVEGTEKEFEPRYEVELTKAGELAGNSYFGRKRFRTERGRVSRMRQRLGRGTSNLGQNYRVRCPYCHKIFTRKTSDTTLKQHKGPGGWPCSGRSGYRVY